MTDSNTSLLSEELDLALATCELCPSVAEVRVIHHTCRFELACRKCSAAYFRRIRDEIHANGWHAIQCCTCSKVFLDIEEWAWTAEL